MDMRDKARSDLYLAQLRTQSAPNTPGYPLTATSNHFPSSSLKEENPQSLAEEGNYYTKTQYATTTPPGAIPTNQPFQLQPPPIRIQEPTPNLPQEGFAPQSPGHSERFNDHINAAPGEQTYASVPIPAAYPGSPLSSPTYPPQQHHGPNSG